MRVGAAVRCALLNESIRDGSSRQGGSPSLFPASSCLRQVSVSSSKSPTKPSDTPGPALRSVKTAFSVKGTEGVCHNGSAGCTQMAQPYLVSEQEVKIAMCCLREREQLLGRECRNLG